MKEQPAGADIFPFGLPSLKNNNNKRKERILVVDQDDGTLSLLFQIIKLTGYDAEFTRTIQEAIRALEKAIFDLLIADYHLPQTQNLIEHLQKHQLPTKTIYLVRQRQAIYEVVQQPQAVFIPKPFTFDEMVNKIHELLHQKYLQQVEEEFQRLRRQLFRF